jgi:hypothetical protein
VERRMLVALTKAGLIFLAGHIVFVMLVLYFAG